MKKCMIVFLIVLLIFANGCALLFGLSNSRRNADSVIDQLGRAREDRTQDRQKPLQTKEGNRLDDIPFSFIDPFDILNDSRVVFDMLEYDKAYFSENPDTDLLERYKGVSRVALPFVKNAAEHYASVSTDRESFSQYFVFEDRVSLDDKLAFYNAICEAVADRYGAIDEGFYHYYDSGGSNRTEDLSFGDETIKAHLTAIPNGDFEFSRAWDPVGADERLVVAFSPNAVMGHQNGDVGVFLYSYHKKNDTSGESQKIVNGSYYPQTQGNPFLIINGTDLTVDYGDDNIWHLTIEVSGKKAQLMDEGKFGNATFEQIDPETIVVENNYFGGSYTLT